MVSLGFDTSNYTTSAALYIPSENRVIQEKKLLSVKKGERGLRQSDAVFQHTLQLSSVTEKLFEKADLSFDVVGASAFPTFQKGSYMPCFLVGLNCAKIISSSEKKPLFVTSHQNGHIAAALYSSDSMELFSKSFVAFHLSGGTTEALLVEPDREQIFKTTLIARSLDLKAGQLIDRTGVMLGLDFPSGRELDELSRKSKRDFGKIKIFSDGLDVSLSGGENKIKAMIEKGESKEDIARFAVFYISKALELMTEKITDKYGSLPLVYSGGVMSNSLIREKFQKEYSGRFAKPEFSSDNAAGVAILAGMEEFIR